MAHDNDAHNADMLGAWDRQMAREQAAEEEYELAFADNYRHRGVVRGGTSGQVLVTCRHRHPDNDDAFLCGEQLLITFHRERGSIT